MKIAHVVDSMEVGGAEMLVLQMCRLQRQQGHLPSVYAIAKLGALGEQMRAEGFSVHANVGRHLVDSTMNFIKLFGSSRFDVVHLHNPTPTIYASFAAKLTGAQCIVSTRHSLIDPPDNQIMERKYSLAAKCCDWIVGICDATVHNLKRIGRVPDRKIVRIYNGAAPIQEVPENELPAKSGVTLLYVGRLEPVKNHELLLTAFRKARTQNSELRLWMVGDGSERGRLEALSEALELTDDVTFWGQQLNVGRFFSAADIFIMSSLSEGLPMSLLQAFSAGLPAVVTDVGGMAEVVGMTGAGIITAANADSMSDAILRLAMQKELRDGYSRSAKAGFDRYFSLERMTEAYMELYRQGARKRRLG